MSRNWQLIWAIGFSVNSTSATSAITRYREPRHFRKRFSVGQARATLFAEIGLFQRPESSHPTRGSHGRLFPPYHAGQKRWDRKVSLSEARDDCRRTFERWGLPDAIQTDHDKVLVPSGEYPFPGHFTLWLIGLGVPHSLIQRSLKMVVWSAAIVPLTNSGCPAGEWPAFLHYVEQEVTRLNERLPSRANACQGKIPIEAHPEARQPQRPYQRENEGQLFSLERVYTYLAQGRWGRQASTHAQFHFADYVWNAGHQFEHQAVVITFTADTHEFVISTTDSQEIKRMPSTWINEAAIRGLA
jgi:hypothetical protein